MSNKTIAIVEDTLPTQNILRHYIQKNHPDLSLVGVAESVEAAYTLLSTQKPDIALLDIKIINGTSFDVLARLSDEGAPIPQLVFVTAHGERENVMKALRYYALDFITKNIAEAELEAAIRQAITRFEQHESVADVIADMMQQQRRGDPFDRLVIKMLGGVKRLVPISDLLYFEAQGELTNVYLTTQPAPLKSAINIGHYRQMLRDDHEFLLIHKSHLVNSLYIEEFDGKKGEIRLTTGQRLSTSAHGNTLMRDYFRRKEERTVEPNLLARIRHFFRGRLGG
jgi:two-component system, LytTR family, response regulator